MQTLFWSLLNISAKFHQNWSLQFLSYTVSKLVHFLRHSVMMCDIVAVPAYDITVTPQQHRYAVNDVITCSAQGFPTPEIQWTRRGTPGNPADDVTVRRSNLTVSEEMVGSMSSSWTCTARNELNTEPLTVDITFSVTDNGTYHRLNCVLAVTHHSYDSPTWLSWVFSGSPLEVRPLNRSSHKMAQSTWIHARMCLLQWKSRHFIPPDLQGP